MLSIRHPTVDSLHRTLVEQSKLDFAYSRLGATATCATVDDLAAPEDYVIDHTRIVLGQGSAVFERAKAALRRWQQFRLGWLEVFPEDAAIRPGETVLVVARAFGLWWTNAARIVYVVD